MTNLLRTLVSRMAFAAILLGSGLAARAGVVLEAPSTVNVGSDFDITLRAIDLNLGGYQLNLGFPPLLVSLTSIAFDNYLGAPLSFTYTTPAPIDSTDIWEISFTDSPSLIAMQGDAASGNSYPLAHLTFHAEQTGVAMFSFNSAVLTDVDANPLTADLTGASVNIVSPAGPPPSAVPEPGSLGLLAMGAGAILIGRWRKERA